MAARRPRTTSSEGRRSQRERREETGKRVVDAAMAHIARNGSRTVTVAQIGHSAGYSRGIVNHHFGTREAMLVAVAEEAQARFSMVPQARLGLDRLAERIGHVLVGYRTVHPAGQAFLLMWAEAIGSEESFGDVFRARDAYFRSVLQQDIEAGIEDGSVRPDVDPGASAVVLVGQTRGIGLQLMLTPEAGDVLALRGLVERLVRSALAARPEPRQP